MTLNQISTGLGPKTSQKEFARAVEVVPRTLRNWRNRTLPEDFPKLGRPAHDARARRVAFWKVGREYLRQGRCGGLAITKALSGAVPTRLIRQHVKRLKACERAHVRRRVLKQREHVEVLAKNALWVQDSAQMARDFDGGKVESQVIKDRGPLVTVGLTTGGPTRGTDVIALLEALKCTRGLPLVLGSDNGSPFICEEVEAYLKRHQVIHLKSLPRTPQHNGSAEVGIGELKRCARMGPDVIAGTEQTHARTLRAAIILNKNRIRASKGFKTGAELDDKMVVSCQKVERAQFYSECSRCIEQVRQSGAAYRAVRMAERDVIFSTMEHYGLIKRYRGGSQATTKAEIFS